MLEDKSFHNPMIKSIYRIDLWEPREQFDTITSSIGRSFLKKFTKYDHIRFFLKAPSQMQAMLEDKSFHKPMIKSIYRIYLWEPREQFYTITSSIGRSFLKKFTKYDHIRFFLKAPIQMHAMLEDKSFYNPKIKSIYRIDLWLSLIH